MIVKFLFSAVIYLYFEDVCISNVLRTLMVSTDGGRVLESEHITRTLLTGMTDSKSAEVANASSRAADWS